MIGRTIGLLLILWGVVQVIDAQASHWSHLVLLCYSLACVHYGIGVAFLNNQARKRGIVVAWLGAVIAVLMIAASWSMPQEWRSGKLFQENRFFGLVFLGQAALIWGLTRPSVRLQFREELSSLQRSISTALSAIMIVGCLVLLWLPSGPPTLSVSIQGQAVHVVSGTSMWLGMCRLRSSGKQFLEEETPVVVAPASKTTFKFSRRPQEVTISVNQEAERKSLRQNLMGENSFMLPKVSGVYFYEVSASWRQGSASYAFMVEVR